MRKILAGLAVACLLLLINLSASAQEFNWGKDDDGHNNLIHAKVGAEYGFVGSLGYTRLIPLADRRLALTTELTLPWASLDIHDYRFQMGAMLPIIGQKHWRMMGKVLPLIRGRRTDMARFTNLGLKLGLLGGFYRENWFLAGELGFDAAITTHIRHRERYLENIYADAKDGWYAPSGGNFYAEFSGGYSLKRWDFILRAGQSRDIRLGTHLLPFYATVGTVFRF